MNGTFIGSKPISVEYAFKKDNKNERHGDEAERRLAKQAKQRGVAPAAQPLPAQLFQAPAPVAPSAPQSMMNGDSRGPPGMSSGMSAYGGGLPGRAPSSLPQAPSGLPARPPSGPPTTYGYSAPPPGFAIPGHGPPPGFAPPSGFPGAPNHGPPGGYHQQPPPQYPGAPGMR